MAQQTVWFYTDLPEKMISIMEEDLAVFENRLDQSGVTVNNIINKRIRNSHHSWISTNHWIGGFAWHYVQKANRENFLYDIERFDGEGVQYTRYDPGEYYHWHTDADLYSCMTMDYSTSTTSEPHENYLNRNCEKIRKLSFILQLSNPEDYEGGNVQFMGIGGKSYFLPRQRGTIAVFDSRSMHRVKKVTKGVRKSIVGWAIGPRWK